MSTTVSTATPSRPTSPSDIAWSESWPISDGMSNAVRQPRLPVVEQVVEALVGLLGGAEARELAHRPEAAAVHRRVDAAREREAAGDADAIVAVCVDGDHVVGRVERVDLLARERDELGVALGVAP